MNLDERFDTYLGQPPTIHPTAYIAPGAIVVGDVTLGKNSSIWFQCTLRADINRIVIGEGSNIQDNSVVHLDNDLGTIVGNYVTCGHRAILHACTIEDECLIGMGSVVMDGVVVGTRSVIGANSLVTKNTIIPPGSLVMGSPAKVIKPLDAATQEGLRGLAEKYVAVSRRFLSQQPTTAPMSY